jgi:hypothetical protein
MEAIYGIPIAALIVGLIEVAKKLGLPTRYAPAVAVVFGIVFAVAYKIDTANGSWLEAVVTGIMVGLTAAGLYSGSKATLGR